MLWFMKLHRYITVIQDETFPREAPKITLGPHIWKRFVHIWQNERATSHQNKAFFDFHSQFSESKISCSSLNMIFFFNVWIVEQLLLLSCSFEVLYFVKMCPSFDGSVLTDFGKYEKTQCFHRRKYNGKPTLRFQTRKSGGFVK